LITIRPLGPDDDLGEQRDLGERAFGLMSPSWRDEWMRRNAPVVAAGRYFGVFDGSRQVGGAMFHDMRQWWGGQGLPMAGMAAVKIAPEIRGQGLGRRLMTEVLREIAARGYPLSALYPATMPIYRSLGWELGGGRYHAVVPARSLRDLVPPDKALTPLIHNDSVIPPLRQVTAADAAEVRRVLGRAHQAARASGPVTRDLASIRDWLGSSTDAYRYLGDDGFISYQWEPGNGRLFVDWMAAASPAALRALLALLAGHSSTADSIEIRTAPDSPLWWLLRERDAELVKRSMWMLRVVDPVPAIAGRGFNSGVSGVVSLNMVTAMEPARSEPEVTVSGDSMLVGWELAVSGGQGKLERTEPDPAALTVGARGLAALYAGTPVATLRLAGLASGGNAEDDAFLTAAFGCSAYMLDDF
jgi:predicted acetyltransferase